MNTDKMKYFNIILTSCLGRTQLCSGNTSCDVIGIIIGLIT